jgi:hypothetical protein
MILLSLLVSFDDVSIVSSSEYFTRELTPSMGSRQKFRNSDSLILNLNWGVNQVLFPGKRAG